MSASASVASFRLRPAVLADAQQLAELCGQLGYPSTLAEVEQRLRAIQSSDEHAIFVAEDLGGKLAGCVHVFLMHAVEIDAQAEILGLVVDANSRSLGVGKSLLALAEQWARERGIHTIGLRSNMTRERAHAFYEREGYSVLKKQKAFRKPLKRSGAARNDHPFRVTRCHVI
jgi:GNAT superfamily N-acetyltransferase